MLPCITCGTRRPGRFAFSLVACFGLLVAGLDGAAHERNFWPFLVQQFDDAGELVSWTAAGPFAFSHPAAEGGTVRGFRPFLVEETNDQTSQRSTLALYPLFTSTRSAESYRWDVFELIRKRGRTAAAPSRDGAFGRDEVFEIWPFWFSHQTGDPATSYRALFPVAGTLQRRLGFERISWSPFPLYVQTESRDAVTTHAPWPFVRVTRGAARGIGLWPLYGRQERPGHSREEFFLWPLGYHQVVAPPPDAPADTPARREWGALPFYTRSTGPGYRSENVLWPFFGYTARTEPQPYRETRYFWPLLVQGRGEDHYVNRWGPFYTHSIHHGFDKRWYMWPLVRRVRLTEDGLVKTKHQVGYFLYWSLEQRSATRPELPAASVRHVWPLFSAWDNGAGHRQVQFPSPLEVFFPGNERMRRTWTPLFSLFRYDRRPSGDVRASLLWNAVTWAHEADDARREFHLGPLASYTRDSEGMQFEFVNGLFGVRRTEAGRSWRLFWFTIPGKRAAVPQTAISPP